MRVTCGGVENHISQAPSHRSGASSNLHCTSDWSTLWRSMVISKRAKSIPILLDDSCNFHIRDYNNDSNANYNNYQSNTDYDYLDFCHKSDDYNSYDNYDRDCY